MAILDYGILDIKGMTHQLKCPTGEEGKKIARYLYESNRGMILDSIASLRIKKRNRILELGPGNGAHLSLLLRLASGLKYFGLDISQAMIKEAREKNREYVTRKSALFSEYDGETIPYVPNLFDRILTVNTIYFWERPKEFLGELHRVLKPGGICVITFVEGHFMEKLPFVDTSFQLYDMSEFVRLVAESSFTTVDVQSRNERARSKNGETVDREYLVATLQKTPKASDQSENGDLSITIKP